MKKKLLSFFLVAGVILIFISYICFRNSVGRTYTIDSEGEKIEKVGKNSKYLYNIDNLDKVNQDNFEVKGWIIKKKENIKNVSINIMLKDDNKFYVLPTKIVKREDVTEKLNDGVNYNFSGFQAYLKKPEGIKQKKSRIYILVEINGDRSIIKTNEYIN